MKLSISIVVLTPTAALVLSGGIVGTNSTTILAAATTEAPALLRAAPVQSEGEQLLQARCAVCHDLGGVDEFQAAYDETSLRDLVATMISYGAQLNDSETDILIAYLLGNEQADAAPVIDEAAAANLVQASCTTCHDLTGIEPGLYTADEWRETVSRMLGYGLSLDEDQFETIVNYLGASPDAADVTVDEETDDGAAPAIDEAAAANLVQASCTTCHDLTGIERGLYPADEWRETVNRMLGYGLSLDEDQFETIVNYLGSSPDAVDATDGEETDDGDAPAFDEAAAANLVQASCTTCHDLTGIERGLYPADEWRETVNRMMGYGLSLDEDQFETIVNYLGSSPDAVDAIDGDDADDGYDAAAAEALLNSACTTCHDLTGITSQPGTYTEADFRETIERMLGYGANLSNDEIDTLVRFLTETYGAQ